MAKAKPKTPAKPGKGNGIKQDSSTTIAKSRAPAQDAPRRGSRHRLLTKRYGADEAATASKVLKRVLPKKRGSAATKAPSTIDGGRPRPQTRTRDTGNTRTLGTSSKSPAPKLRGRPKKTTSANPLVISPKVKAKGAEQSPVQGRKSATRAKRSVLDTATVEPWTDSPKKKSPTKRPAQRRSASESDADPDYADDQEDAEGSERASKRVRQASVGGIRTSIEGRSLGKRRRSPSKSPSRAGSTSPARKKASVTTKARSKSPAKRPTKLPVKTSAKRPFTPPVPASPNRPVASRTRSKSPSTPGDVAATGIKVAKVRSSRGLSKPRTQTVSRSRSASPAKRAAPRVTERRSSAPPKSPSRPHSKSPSKASAAEATRSRSKGPQRTTATSIDKARSRIPAKPAKTASPEKTAPASSRGREGRVTAAELQDGLRGLGRQPAQIVSMNRSSSSASANPASLPSPVPPVTSNRARFGRTPSPAKSRAASAAQKPMSPVKTAEPEPGRGSVISSTNPPEIPNLNKKNPFYETMPAPTIWHRRMPPFLPFGETPFMEGIMSRQISDDLSRGQVEQAEKDKASASYFSQASSTVKKFLFGQKAAPEVIPYASPWDLPDVDDDEVLKLVKAMEKNDGKSNASPKKARRGSKSSVVEMSGAL